MQLYIGNKNYSSWSLRPWLLMTHTGIAFEEIKLSLNFEAS
jgi:glutathione S-transferase